MFAQELPQSKIDNILSHAKSRHLPLLDNILSLSLPAQMGVPRPHGRRLPSQWQEHGDCRSFTWPGLDVHSALMRFDDTGDNSQAKASAFGLGRV